MKRVISWFAENSVAANLLMAVIIIAGLLTAPRVRREVFPEFELDFVTVSVPYPGAAPEEIEKSITSRIEDRVASIEGVEKITSSAAENSGTVLIEALPGSDILELLDEVKTAVDAIDTFPEEAEEPSIRRVVARHHVLSIAIHGVGADEAALKHLGERLRDDLSALPEITQVELTNARPYEISIEVSESALRSYGLTFDDVAEAVRRSSLDLPGGSVKTTAGEVLLRTQGQAYEGAEFEDIVLLTRADGTRLYVRDVATVVDGFEDSDQQARFDGESAVIVAVYRVGEQSALAISAAAKEYVAAHAASLPPGISMTAWNDESSVLRDRLEMLGRNGLQGLVLVFLTLAIFLQFRLAIWTSVGIPLSFLGAVWLMPTLGVSINILSLFSFILVLGIVVDDAIVVGENVFKKKEAGLRGLDAAVQGTQEVTIPVIFGVLTTVAVFFPMLVIPGITGNIMKTFPLIVIPTLLFSLVESQLILPSHLKHVVVDGSSPRGVFGLWKRLQNAASRGLRRVIDKLYRPALEWALEWRYTVAAAGLVFLAVTTALLGTGRLRMRFFPDAEADFVVANLTMPLGTPVSITQEALAQLEAAAISVRDGYDQGQAAQGGSSVRHMLVAVADQPFSQGHGPRRAHLGSHVGQIILQLAPAEQRAFSSTEMAARWRELSGPIADAIELSFSGTLVRGGDAIDIQLSSTSIEDLRDAAARLEAGISRYEGVTEVADSFRPGKQELQLAIKPEAESLGLTLSDLARQVRQAFYGEEAQRVQRGREDIRVMVRYPAAYRRSLADLGNMRIRTPDGSEVPFSTVASVEYGRGYATIERADRQRVVHVTADVDAKRGNEYEIVADLKLSLLHQLRTDYPGLRYSLEGQQRARSDMLGSLKSGMVLALFVVYALMAVPLRSYHQPLIVMTAIPFGVAGALWAHVILGMNLSFMSVFGIVALVGVVVNDSLVLVDYINHQRDSDSEIVEVLREAGAARFRPILLTSLTTFVGLVPLLLERSFQAQFVIPMAVSLAFGVLFATVVSLVMVPCTYLIFDDLAAVVASRRTEHEDTELSNEARRRADNWRTGGRTKRRDWRLSRDAKPQA